MGYWSRSLMISLSLTDRKGDSAECANMYCEVWLTNAQKTKNREQVPKEDCWNAFRQNRIAQTLTQLLENVLSSINDSG